MDLGLNTVQAKTRTISLDVFDTCLTRRVLDPGDIFEMVGSSMCSEGLWGGVAREFRDLRQRCEKRSRPNSGLGETTLAGIYECLGQELGWSDRVKSRAQELELEWESRCLFGIPGFRSFLNGIRSQCSRVLFISDMYLPSGFIQEILKREGFWQDDDRIYVSCEWGASKGDGMLFKVVKEKEGILDYRSWMHYGDNLRSDVRIPAKLGIRAEGVSCAELTNRERKTAARTLDASLATSRLLGAVRSVRLKLGEHPNVASRYLVGATVVGPILFGYVLFCLAKAIESGSQRLYFISRDGQILYKLAKVIVRELGLHLDCRYVYGSRQAWLPASFERFTEKEFGWLFAPAGSCNFTHIEQRLGLPKEMIQEKRRQMGIAMDQVLGEAELNHLRSWLLEASVTRSIEATAAERRLLVTAYLEQEGFFEDVKWGMVDIGWAGNLQRSLGQILTLARSVTPKPFTGYYFGLTNPDVISPFGQRLAYWNKPGLNGADILRLNQAMFEIFTSADHPSVVGYSRGKESIEPVFADKSSEAVLNWGVEAFQNSMLVFAQEALVGMPYEAGDIQGLRSVTRNLFEEFYSDPSVGEAEAIGKFPFSDQQFETDFYTIVPAWGIYELLRSMVDYRRRPTGWWPEGMRSIHPSFLLKSFLFVRNSWRRCKGKEANGN